MDWKDHLRSFEKMRDSTHQPQKRIRQKSDPMGNFLGETKRSPSSNCYAKGGVVSRNSPQNLTPRRARRLAHEGRGGDTRLAAIGPEVARLMDQLVHGGKIQRNPRTGLREYMTEEEFNKLSPQAQVALRTRYNTEFPEGSGMVQDWADWLQDKNYETWQAHGHNQPVHHGMEEERPHQRFQRSLSYDTLPDGVARLHADFDDTLRQTRVNKQKQQSGNCEHISSMRNRAYQRQRLEELDSDNDDEMSPQERDEIVHNLMLSHEGRAYLSPPYNDEETMKTLHPGVLRNLLRTVEENGGNRAFDHDQAHLKREGTLYVKDENRKPIKIGIPKFFQNKEIDNYKGENHKAFGKAAQQSLRSDIPPLLGIRDYKGIKNAGHEVNVTEHTHYNTTPKSLNQQDQDFETYIVENPTRFPLVKKQGTQGLFLMKKLAASYNKPVTTGHALRKIVRGATDKWGISDPNNDIPQNGRAIQYAYQFGNNPTPKEGSEFSPITFPEQAHPDGLYVRDEQNPELLLPFGKLSNMNFFEPPPSIG